MKYNNLIYLCIQGNIKEIIEYLVDDDCNSNKVEDTFSYILINNMENIFFNVIDFITQKIDIYSNEQQIKYFEHACLGGSIKILKWFLDNNYNISNLVGCLSATTFNNNYEATKFLILNGANTFEHINCDNCFAFLNVINNDNKELIKLFIKNKVDIDNTINVVNKEYKEEHKTNIINKIFHYSSL